ncbi:MAG: DUF4105 domain-containing protein [Sulfuricurvum sp.]|nr:DUF4105 domain-containing protein [Sulfuricurvum sp.]
MPVIFLLCALSLAVFATTTDELIAQEHSLNLSESRYWHLLMHAPKESSEIDDDAFFLSPIGKENLDEELISTLRHLNEDSNRSDGSVFCRFPARRVWLEKSLNISFGEGECREYETLLAKLDPQKVTLVFPSAHINSPASMFGHTFLRIDSSMESKLMSYAINYAAQTDETNGVAFAYKGLFGGYYGYYSMLPYYEKLKEYRDSESRDVWEYDLNLNHDEVMAMVRHIWELQHINSWYYFFDENCSYHMLWLTEIARPTARLRDHFFYYVIPPETVRAFEEESLVREKHFRPSKRTKILSYERQLKPQGIQAVRSLVNGETDMNKLNSADFTDQERRYIFEAAAELVEYDYIEGKISKEVYALRYHTLLTRRAALGEGKIIPIEPKPNPDSAHRSARIGIVQGWFEKRSPLLIGWRPAFHDLSEDDTGHLSGAQIEFLDTLIGIDKNTFSLEKLTLLSLSSLPPVTHFFKPFSWRMKSGWDRDYTADTLSFVTRVGAGASIGDDQIYAYWLSEPEIRLGFKADAGIGFTTGGGINWRNRVKSRIEAGRIFYMDGVTRTHLMMTHLWGWGANGAVSVSYETAHQNYREDRYKLGVNLYF